ncbi:hypothetical protein B0H10DRAFT_2110147 [Mycena sp. CBHHK59/15]|nr:hypothetical protein B0H10DRAFT_2110147 [Mycena sp. CBHHK59/15]
MDSSLPVVNTITPTLPNVAQPAAVSVLTDNDQDSLAVSSSKRSMVGQTNTSFTNMLGRQASESMESLINFLDPAPATPASKAKPKPGAAPADSSASANTTAPSAALKPAPAGKSESGVAGIKRLDANMSAMASRIENHITQHYEHIAELKDDLSLTRNQLKTVVADATGLGVSGGFSAKDMLEHPTMRAIIASNNASVGMIEELRAAVSSLTSTIADMRSTKRKHDDDTFMYSEDVFLPAVKRVARASDIPTTVAPSAGGVDIGPINWGKDISGQVRGLIARMSRGKNIDAEAVKNVYAKRFPKNNKFVTAYFPTNVAAIQFVTAWEAAPPPGYERTSVSFASGN